MNAQTTNGHSKNPGFDFSSWTAPQIERRLSRVKRPGRPSQEVVALREALEVHGTEERQPGHKPASRGRGAGVPVVGEKVVKKLDKIQIIIPTIETGMVTVRVRGMTSLIMHKWDEKSTRQIEEKQQGKATKGRGQRNPQAEWHAARYIKGKHDCVPALSFKNAMVAAASFLPDVTKTLLKGAVFVKGDLLPIKYKGKEPIFRKDMVRIGGMSKTADVRYRPEYPDWEVDLDVEFDSSVISAEQVVNLVARAGFNVGVGEWRPIFGRFRVIRT